MPPTESDEFGPCSSAKCHSRCLIVSQRPAAYGAMTQRLIAVLASSLISLAACGGAGSADSTPGVNPVTADSGAANDSMSSGGASADGDGSSGNANAREDGGGDAGESGGGSTSVGSEQPPGIADGPTPHNLSDFPHCADAQLGGLAAICGELTQSGEVVDARGTLQPSTTSLIQLSTSGGTNRASVSFTTVASGAFTIYLGTPNIPFSISAGSEAILPTCSRYLTPELSQKLTGTECRDLLGVYVVSLRAGVTYLLHFGPITPERWVRVYVQPMP
jgi:hypothetical protein